VPGAAAVPAVPGAAAVPATAGAAAVPATAGAAAVPGTTGAAGTPGTSAAPGTAGNATESEYAPDNPDPLGIGGDATLPLINPRNPLNLGGSLIHAGGAAGTPATVLDNPNVLRQAMARAAVLPPPPPPPPTLPPINVTDCANVTLVDGGCPLLTPPYDVGSSGVSTASGTIPAGGVSSPLYPLQQAPLYPYALAPPGQARARARAPR